MLCHSLDHLSRRAWMVGDCGARVVVAARGDAVAREWVSAERNVPVLWVDEAGAEGPAPSEPALRLSGESAAYVMYTSGSTGQAKGVMVTHRSIVRLVCNTDYVELGAASRGDLDGGHGIDAA